MKSRDPKLARTAAKTAETIKQAKSEAVVREHGTESERTQLLFSSLMASNGTLTALHAAAEGNGPEVVTAPPDPGLLARLTRRAERRAKLKLPKMECAADPPTPSCRCLERALDEPGDGGKRHVLKRAATLHWSPPPPVPANPLPEEPTPDPQQGFVEPQEATENVEEPPAEPRPKPKAPDPPPRVVKHFPRWYDQNRRFEDMRF